MSTTPESRRGVVRRTRHGRSTNGLCDFFVDKVKQVKAKVEHSLLGTPSDNRLTEPALIKPQRSLKSFACVTASEVERLIKSAPMKTSSVDQLPISVVKSCSAEFSAIIATTKTSCKAGRFPSAWKAGLVCHYSKSRASTLRTSRASGQ